MKKTAAMAIALSMLTVCIASAQDKNDFGIGIIIGEPTGLSIKKWLGNDRAIDAGIAWSFSGNDSLHLHADYLFHRFDVFSLRAGNGQLPIYYGLGARVKLKDNNNDKNNNDNDVRVGIRVPLGISYLFANAPFDIFAEIVPVLDIAPDLDLDLNLAIGARFYF